MSLDKFFPMQMFWFVFGRFAQVQGQLQRNLAVKACGISSYQWHSVTTSWLFLEPLKETKNFSLGGYAHIPVGLISSNWGVGWAIVLWRLWEGLHFLPFQPHSLGHGLH